MLVNVCLSISSPIVSYVAVKTRQCEILKEVNNRPDFLSVYSNPERKNVKHKLIQKARKTSEIMPRKSLSR